MIDGVTIHPGDVVTGDGDGVVVVAANDLERVVELAEEIDRMEDLIVAAIDAGSSLREARAELGYHRIRWRAR